MAEVRDEARGNRRRRWFAVSGLVVAGVAAISWMVTPDAAGRPGAGFSVPLDVGQTTWIGLERLVGEPVTVRGVEAVTDATAQIVICHRTHGQDVIGSVRDEDLTGYCTRTEPVVAGTRLEPTPRGAEPSAYVLVGLTATETTPQVYCGLDLRYRAGLRFGRAFPAGPYRGVMNPTHDDAQVHVEEDCPGRRFGGSG